MTMLIAKPLAAVFLFVVSAGTCLCGGLTQKETTQMRG